MRQAIGLLAIIAACSPADPDSSHGLDGSLRGNANGAPIEEPVLDGGPAPPDPAVPPAPQGTAGVLYEPPTGNVLLAYSRVIRLAHGAAKGTLLATFEHSRTDGAPSEYLIRKSTDDGLTWTTLSKVPDGTTSTFYQPFLFELPTAMGSHPAGTLLLTGNVLPKVGDRHQPTFKLWRSTDAGATWSFVTTYHVGETGISITRSSVRLPFPVERLSGSSST